MHFLNGLPGGVLENVLLERLKRLEENVGELYRFRERVSLEDIRSSKTQEWALRYGLLETIQGIIDIACHIVSRENLGNPATYAECIALLERNGYIDAPLARKLQGMVGLRNLLIHEYTSIDLAKLYQCLFSLEDFLAFVYRIRSYLEGST